MALSEDTLDIIQTYFPDDIGTVKKLSSIPGFDDELNAGFQNAINETRWLEGYDPSGGNFLKQNIEAASTNPTEYVLKAMRNGVRSAVNQADPVLLTKQIDYLKQNNVPLDTIRTRYTEHATKQAESDATTQRIRAQQGGGFFGGLSSFLSSNDPFTAISKGLAQVDKDLSLSQNAPVIAAIALSVAAPGVGSAIGQQMITAGLLPAATSAAVATAVGTGVANAALQVAQGKSPEEALKAGIVGAAGGAVGNYLGGDPGAVKNFITSTSTNLLAGKNPEDAVKAAIINAGAGLAGSTATQETGSAVAGQVAAGTTAGLLSGKTGEQALIQGVGNINAASLFPGSATTVPTEQQALAGQQDLQNQLAPFEVDTTASSFDTKDIINDGSGFSPPSPTPQTPITESTGGNMETDYTEDPYADYISEPRYNYSNYDEMNDPATMLQDTTPYNFTPEEQQLIYQLAQEQGYDDPTGGAGGLGTSQNPSMYGNLTVEQLRRLLGGGGGGAAPRTPAPRTQQPATQSLLQRLLGGATGRQPSLQLGGAAGQLGNLLGGAVSGAGGILAGQTAAKAAEEQARMISGATGQAVGGSQFRPIGTTTRWGTSQFGFDPTTGQLTSAGYQLTPELKAMQDRVIALTGQGLTEAEQAAGRYAPLTAGAQGLFGLGQQYLAQSPEQVAADYIAKQQNLLAPSREREFAQLQNRLFQTGRGGLSVGGTGMRPGGGEGLRASSPEMEAYYNALAQQDAQLAAGAQQAGQQQVQFGAGLMGTGANLLGAYGQGLTGAYAPFSTGIGVGSSLEQLGQQPLSLSQQLAQLSSASGARAGELGIRGTTAAAAARLPSMQFNPLARALVGAGGNTQFGGALGEFVGGALPGLFGAGTTINPLRTDEFGRVEPLTPEEQQAQDEMMQNYNNQLAAYRAKGGQGLYIPGVTG